MKTNEPPPDPKQCEFPNCSGMLMLQATTKATDAHIVDIKDGLSRLPEILEHVAEASTNIQSIKADILRILKDHDEIFQRLRVLEVSDAKSSWSKALKKSCIQLAVVIAGAIIISLLGFMLYLVVAHWSEFMKKIV